MRTLFRVLIPLFLLALLIGCAPKVSETAEVGEDYAHFHYGGAVFYLDYTTPTVSVIPSHFLPVGELILSSAEDDLCGNVEGTLLMSENHPDFAYVELPGSEEDARVYAIFSADGTEPPQDLPADPIVFVGGLDVLLAEEYNENQLFDVVIRIFPKDNWSVEQEQVWLDSFGFSFPWQNDHFRGNATGAMLQSFPKHQSCSYEIIPALLYESAAGKQLLCLGDETACQSFLDGNGIVIPEELAEIVTARGLIMHAEMNPHTPLGVSHAVLYDLSEAVRAAVLQYHGFTSGSQN